MRYEAHLSRPEHVYRNEGKRKGKRKRKEEIDGGARGQGRGEERSLWRVTKRFANNGRQR